MKSFYKVISLLFLIGLIAQCQKEELTSRDFPRLRTLPVSNISAAGATFSAEIGYRGDFEVLNYGFVWRARRGDPALPDDARVIFTGDIQAQQFSSEITVSLQTGVTYNVRAFIQTNDYLVYGNNIQFQSLGGNGPDIQALRPASGTIGDTIDILGNQFSHLENLNKVFFDDKEAVLLSYTDTLLKVIVPEIEKAEVKVSVSILGNKADFDGVFLTTTPVIDDFSPKTIAIDDTLTISGQNFNAVAEYNSLTISGLTCEVVTASETSLKAIIPAGLPTDNTLKLTIAGQTSQSVSSLKFQEPIVKSLSSTQVTFGEPITIFGEHLSFIPEHNEIKISLWTVPVVSATKDSIKFLIPDELTQLEIPVSYSVAGRTFNLDTLRLKPPVFEGIEGGPITQFANQTFDIIGQNFNSLKHRNEVLVDGKEAKLIAVDYDRLTVAFPNGIIPFPEISLVDSVDLQIRVLNQSITISRALPIAYESTYSKRNKFPGKSRTFGAGFTIGDKVYYGLGRGNPQLSDFWEYDPANDAWKRLADLPGTGREKVSHFVIGNKAYIVGGFSGQEDVNRTILDEVWEFDAETYQWTKKSNFPGTPGWGAFGFALNRLGYVGGGFHYQSPPTNLGPITGKSDVWQYNPENDSWKQLNDLPSALQNNISYYNDPNRDYYAVTDQGTAFMLRYPKASSNWLWQYDQVNDTWISLSTKNSIYYSIQNQGFAMDGLLYFPVNNFRILAYDPVTEYWRESSYSTLRFNFGFNYSDAFATGNRSYLLGGQSFWNFDPSKL